VHTGRRWYLIGWDVDRQKWRTYRVDRLDLRTPTGPRFTPRTPPDPDISGYTSRAISTSAYRYQANFTLHVSAETAAQRIAPTTGALECCCGPRAPVRGRIVKPNTRGNRG
jgi:predicted DNA-binding transcriptional regulator YafY